MFYRFSTILQIVSYVNKINEIGEILPLSVNKFRRLRYNLRSRVQAILVVRPGRPVSFADEILYGVDRGGP